MPDTAEIERLQTEIKRLNAAKSGAEADRDKIAVDFNKVIAKLEALRRRDARYRGRVQKVIAARRKKGKSAVSEKTMEKARQTKAVLKSIRRSSKL